MADMITTDLDTLTRQFVERSIIDQSSLTDIETDAKTIRRSTRSSVDCISRSAAGIAAGAGKTGKRTGSQRP